MLVGRPEHGAWAAVDQAAGAEPAADGLTADLDVLGLADQQGDGPAGPATAEETEVARGLLGDPGDDESNPPADEAKGSAGLVPAQALHALGTEPLDPAVDRPGATEEERGDGGPGMAVVQEQEDMGTEADLGLGVPAVSAEHGRPLLGAQADATGHGDAGVCRQLG